MKKCPQCDEYSLEFIYSVPYDEPTEVYEVCELCEYTVNLVGGVASEYLMERLK